MENIKDGKIVEKFRKFKEKFKKFKEKFKKFKENLKKNRKKNLTNFQQFFKKNPQIFFKVSSNFLNFSWFFTKFHFKIFSFQELQVRAPRHVKHNERVNKMRYVSKDIHSCCKICGIQYFNDMPSMRRKRKIPFWCHRVERYCNFGCQWMSGFFVCLVGKIYRKIIPNYFFSTVNEKKEWWGWGFGIFFFEEKFVENQEKLKISNFHQKKLKFEFFLLSNFELNR